MIYCKKLNNLAFEVTNEQCNQLNESKSENLLENWKITKQTEVLAVGALCDPLLKLCSISELTSITALLDNHFWSWHVSGHSLTM